MGTHMQYKQATSKQTQVQKESRQNNGLESSYVDTTFTKQNRASTLSRVTVNRMKALNDTRQVHYPNKPQNQVINNKWLMHI